MSGPAHPERLFAVIAAASALISVALGAFGAHGLKARVTPSDLAIFETGARYQMYHALALLFVVWGLGRWPGVGMTSAGWFFIAGTLLFSGSLYALVLTGQRALGMVTPIGGLCFLIGWALVIVAAWKG